MLGKWKEYRYTDLATIIGGGTPKTSVPDYWNGEIPWLSVKDFVPVTKYVYDTEKHISELGLLNSSTKLLEKKRYCYFRKRYYWSYGDDSISYVFQSIMLWFKRKQCCR